jgi:hypothetical protein
MKSGRDILITKFRDTFRKCLTCHRDLKDKAIRKMQTRCNKCMKKYHAIWFRTDKEFLETFKGQA